MSNPPFRSPFYSEDDDFSFPVEAPNNDTNNNILDEGIIPDLLHSTSLPMLDYQDLSKFLDHEEDFSLIGQFPTTEETKDWVDHVLQGADGSTEGLDIRHHPINHDQTAATTSAGEGSSTKKLDHNARERVRRMKLNASYMALRSLLPDSKRAKEKWSAPYMMDRTLEYIPQLQAEIEKLTLEKNNMLSAMGKKQVLISDDNQEAQTEKQTLTVSINEVKRGEVIIQICQQRDKVEHFFSALTENLESEGMQIVSASSIWACEDRSCFHIHIKMGENPPLEANYVSELHRKLISWLS